MRLKKGVEVVKESQNDSGCYLITDQHLKREFKIPFSWGEILVNGWVGEKDSVSRMTGFLKKHGLLDQEAAYSVNNNTPY